MNPRSASPRLRVLSYTTVVATYLLITMGGVVRASGSGLGCPDWPLCYGQLVPPGHAPAAIEYAHRLLGGIAGLLIAATVVGWARHRRWTARAVGTALLIIGLLGLQVALGALVVNLELPPLLVLVHLGMAMVLLGLLVLLAADVSPRPAAPPAGAGAGRPADRFLRLVIGATAAVWLLIVVGALVRATGASWACAGFPTCNGAWLPFGTGRLVDTHLLHRLLAYAVAVHLAVVIVRACRSERAVPAIPRAAMGVAFALAAQLTIGIAAVSTGVPPLLQALHVAGAAALWGTTVALLAVTLGARGMLGGPGPFLEGGRD